MKYNRLLWIVIGVFFLTGCSADYTLTIDENLKFSEAIQIEEDNIFFTYNKQTPQEYIDMHKSVYEEDSIYKKFDYQVKIKPNNTLITAKRTGMDLETFNNESILYGTLFSSIIAEKEGDQLKIYTTDYKTEFFAPPFLEMEPSYQNTSFVLKTPFTVIQSNADEIDAEKGIYKWNFNKNIEPKNIEILLDVTLPISKRLLLLLKKFWYIPSILIIVIVGYIGVQMRIKRSNKI